MPPNARASVQGFSTSPDIAHKCLWLRGFRWEHFAVCWPLTCCIFMNNKTIRLLKTSKGCSMVTSTSRFAYVTALVLGLAGLTLSAPASFASDAAVGTYGAPFLRIPVGARLIASPDVVAGFRPDASLLFSNPAFTTGIRNREIFFSTANWLDDMRYSAVGATIPIRGAGHLSVGSTLLYSGGLEGYDDALNVVSEENYYDLGARLGYGYEFDQIGVSVGLGMTYIRQHLYPEAGSGVAFTAGASYQFGQNLFHAVVRDVGGSVDFSSRSYKVDAQSILGAARRFQTDFGNVIAGGQFVASDATGNSLQFGVDYELNQFFTIRTGYEQASSGTDRQNPLNAGFGLSYGNVMVEYAYSSRDYFDGSHTFSMVFRLRGLASRTEEQPVPPLDSAPIISETQIQRTPASNPGIAISPDIPENVAVEEPPATEGKWLLIARSFNFKREAEELVKTLASGGIRSSVMESEEIFHVLIRRFETLDEAVRVMSTYRSNGHKFRIVED